MSLDQKEIDICVFATVFECITAIMKNNLNIEQMKKIINRLEQWVSHEEQIMARKP